MGGASPATASFRPGFRPSFGTALEHLQTLMMAHRPTLVVCVGQAGGRAALSLERVAINLIDARIADNALAQPVDEPVVAGGPAAYFSTLPVKAMRVALQRQGWLRRCHRRQAPLSATRCSTD
jgi:pyrrolidone-carboxylate peptidase